MKSDIVVDATIGQSAIAYTKRTARRTHTRDAFQRERDATIARRTAPFQEDVRTRCAVKRARDALLPWHKREDVEEYGRDTTSPIGGRSQVDLYVDSALGERCVFVTPEMQRAVLEAVVGHVYVGDSADLRRSSQRHEI